jgi:hypothetical protein
VVFKMKKIKTVDWIWFRFNDIISYCDRDDIPIQQWLVDDFKKRCYYLRTLDDNDIWAKILKEFDINFDDCLLRENS